MGIAKDKLNEAQKREVERLRQFATRNRFELKMNSTRWRAAIDAILAVEGFAIGYRCRCITDAQEPSEEWQSDFPHGLPLYNAIEWLEVHWVSLPGAGREMRLALKAHLPERLKQLEANLKAENVPFQAIENGIRIVGYQRT